MAEKGIAAQQQRRSTWYYIDGIVGVCVCTRTCQPTVLTSPPRPQMELEAKRAAAAEAKEELTTIEAKVADIHTKYDRQLSRLDRKRREAAAEAAECDAEAAAIAEEEAEHDAAMAMVRFVNPLLPSESALGPVVAGWSL